MYIETRTFPKFSFRHGQSDLFPSTATKKKWYNNINWNYGLNFNNQDKDYYESYQIDSAQFSWDTNDKRINKIMFCYTLQELTLLKNFLNTLLSIQALT